MKLTEDVWNKYSAKDVLKFCVDLEKKEIWFQNFDIPHATFAAAAILKKERVDDEISLLKELRNRVVGGMLVKGGAGFKCWVGYSSIENELDYNKMPHNARAINDATALCVAQFSAVSFIQPLIVVSRIKGRPGQKIRLPLAA